MSPPVETDGVEDIVSNLKTYPAQSKTARGDVNGIGTEVTTTFFTDRIMITLAQEGRLAQWVQVPLSPRDPQNLEDTTPASSMPDPDDADNDLLPLPHLNATTLLGASNEERETTGQLYATQIASSILARRPDESRILMVGLGLKPGQTSREQFFDLLELAMQTIV